MVAEVVRNRIRFQPKTKLTRAMGRQKEYQANGKDILRYSVFGLVAAIP